MTLTMMKNSIRPAASVNPPPAQREISPTVERVALPLESMKFLNSDILPPDDLPPDNLPPDQSSRIHKSDTLNSFLLLSVSDIPTYLGEGSDLDPDLDLHLDLYSKVHIFSESITFTGDLLIPQGISLFCNDITVVSPKKIDATGANGANQTPTELAKNGAQGGSINFYIQNGSSKVSESIKFVANGGAGGDNTIDASQAGNGGDGGHVVRIFQSNCSALVDTIAIFLRAAEVSGLPVAKGDPIYSAASHVLHIANDLSLAEGSVKDLIEDLQNRLTDIDNGTTVTDHSLEITMKNLKNDLGAEILSKQEDNFNISVSFVGGDPGSGFGGRRGESGERGSDIYSFQKAYHDKTIRQTELAFVHPEQCTMLLERAKVFYYMGLQAQATGLLQRILRRLSFLPLIPEDPLHKAYTESDIMPLDSLDQLESIKKDAVHLYTQLMAGLCYNGNKENWVPRQSYAYLDDRLHEALEDHKAFEDTYIKYHASLSGKHDRRVFFQSAETQASQNIAGYETDIDDLTHQLQESDISIKALAVPVKSTHGILMEEYTKVESRVKDHFGLGFPQMINALRSIAFAGKSAGPMVAVEGLDLTYQGVTSIPTLSGTTIDKDIIFQEIRYGEATVESFNTTLGKQLNGEYDPNDTKAIIISEDKMMKFLDSFTHTSLAGVITEMKGKFDAFVKAIIPHNNEVLHYNVLLKLIEKKFADKAVYEAKKKDLKRAMTKVTDSELPIITANMGDIYQSSRTRVMKLLDNLVRSFNFHVLAHEDIYNLAFSGSTDYDQVPLTLTWNVLHSAHSRIKHKFVEKLWSSVPQRFPSDFNNGEGKRIHLSDDDVKRLVANPKNPLVVQIPVMRLGTLEWNQFFGCCNIRIYRVRFGFVGLTEKEDTASKEEAFVSVKLTHSGTEEIVDKDNKSHKFEHDAITAMYSFNLHHDGTIKEVENGNINEADVGQPKTNYATPGPFPDYWEIDLHASLFHLLDFSGVTDAYFDFCGTNYAF